MQTHIPLIHIDYSHSSDQISTCPTQSSVKSENNGYPSPSPKESSHASNHVRSIESANGPDFEAPAITTNENEENLYHCQEPSSGRNLKPANMVGPAEFYGPVSAKKVACQSEYDIKGVGTGIPAELDTSNAQESSCMSSVLDGISLEATSFRQLQQVMEQVWWFIKLWLFALYDWYNKNWIFIALEEPMYVCAFFCECSEWFHLIVFKILWNMKTWFTKCSITLQF